MIKAILFDLDGTLADTERLGIQTAIQVCKEYGVELSVQEKLQFIGVTDREFYKSFFEKKGLNINVNEALSKHESLYEKELEQEYRLFAGVPEMLKELSEKGYKLALVSGSTRKQIDLVFRDVLPLKIFDSIVCCDDKVLSKPHPEGYFRALEHLKISARDGVAVEESVVGIEAAHAAGLSVVGIKNLGDQDISNADYQVNDVNELWQKLKII